MTIAADDDRQERADLLTSELPAFAEAILAVLPSVEQRFGIRKVYISALWSAVEAAGHRITLNVFKRRLLAARAAGQLELARADLVAAMDPALVLASETHELGAEYHFVIDRTALEPWQVEESAVADRIPVLGATS